ncbi:MAG: TaqI-like C-terminal specificity domain-containing protein [Nitrososphaeria archaeon]
MDETGKRYEWYALQRCAASYFPEFEKEKIVWGLTADKWAFAIDTRKNYLPSNGYILTSEDIPLEVIIAQLNSDLLKFYFDIIGVMTAGGAYTLKHETIQEFPLIVNNKKLNQELIKIVQSILKIAKDTNSQEKKNELEQLESQINRVVYQLYDLSNEEIEIINRKLKIEVS